MGSPSDLSFEEAFAVGVVVVYLIYEGYRAGKEISRSQGSSPRREREFTALGECYSDSLDRLEDGESIIIDRWHGHKLELRGHPVIDADALPENEEGDDE
jgi:hypothetical protein